MNTSFLSGLFIGCLIGALGRYSILNFIGGRKDIERNQGKIHDLNMLFNEYPHFMSCIKTNVVEPQYRNIREFFVVEKDAILNMSVPRLRYDLSEEIIPALSRLKKLGYIEQIKNNCLLYKMQEDFVSQLRSMN